VFNTLLTGLCFSYFQHIHRRHHPHCNERDRDPDMQSGAFSMYPQSAAAKPPVGRLISRYQAYLIWPLACLQGFTLKIDSIKFLCRNPGATLTDQLVLLGHFFVWFGPPVYVLGPTDAALNYALMTLLTGPYLGTIFLVNHIGTRVVEPEERPSHFVQEISTTRNLGSSRAHDFLFGGLNNHIEHHVFPTIPSARLRVARRITREFCRQHAIPYRETSWCMAAREVFRHLDAMSHFVPRGRGWSG
jgi:fatty acid desaturase